MFEHNGQIVAHAMRNGKEVYGMRGGQFVHASFLAEYPTLTPILAEYPTLTPILAEDNEVVHSLVETGYERWIYNNKTAAYIATDIPLNSLQDGLYARHIKVSSHTGYAVVASNNTANWSPQNMCIGTHWWRAGFSTAAADCVTTSATAPLNSVLESYLSASHKYLKQDGVVKAESTAVYTTDFSGILHIFNPSSYTDGKIAEVRVDGLHAARLIPMKKSDGTCGMADIMTGKFYPNSNTTGTFTIELTKK